MANTKKPFHYTYSAMNQREISAIRSKYGLEEPTADPRDETLEELRRLDAATSRPGTVAALTVGIIGTLIMGTGMSLALELSDRYFVLGIIVGVIGIAILLFAYPLFKRITEKQKMKNAPRIRELSEKLMDPEE